VKFEDLLALSPVPLVSEASPHPPRDGFLIAAPVECKKNFDRDERCKRHYESLRDTSTALVQCPYGFASMLVPDVRVVLSGLIPYPRLGGDQERLRAKRYSKNRVSEAALTRIADALVKADRRVHAAEADAIRKQSVALHEIRKLNRNVKQTAERLCGRESPEDPDQASPELVRILKTSELMSYQFEVLELLANEGLTSLPLNTQSEIYRIFDKCVRIYQPERSNRIAIHAMPGYGNPVVMVCEKTFPIIPTVLIENAIKHSVKDSHIRVDLSRIGGNCVVNISSVASSDVELTEAIFERGVRANTDVEGSGNGLHLAQLVARQHGTRITLATTPLTGGRQRVVFSLRLPSVSD
jgi:light-regulated signal transduction histidine kinase (bacteriophytochrome)